MAASNATSSKALDKILALEAQVSQLRHHVSVPSKGLYRLDPPREKVSRADSKGSPVIAEDILRLAGGGRRAEKEEVVEQSPEWLMDWEVVLWSVEISRYVSNVYFITLLYILLLSLCIGFTCTPLTLLQLRYILWYFIVYFRIIFWDLTCAFLLGI